MNIVVCIKQVPDTTEVKINPVTGTLIREGVPSIMNPDDKGGLEFALQLKDQYGAHVTVITMGLPQAEAILREALAMGVDRVILGADVRHGRLSINGWLEQSDTDVLNFIGHYHGLGVRQVLCTDIAKDGTLTGPSLPLYQQIMDAFPDLYLIASGGVSSDDDIRQLEAAGIPAVVFGKAFYEGRLTITPSRL